MVKIKDCCPHATSQQEDKVLVGVQLVYQRQKKVSQDIVVKVKTCQLMKMRTLRFLQSRLIAAIGESVIQNVEFQRQKMKINYK